MQRNHRWAARLGLVILGLALAGLLASQGTAQKVKKVIADQPPATMGTGTAANMSSVKIQEDARFRQVLNVGRDCIKDQEWKQGVEALQTILNLKEGEDHYVQVREQDPVDHRKENTRWTSVKFEANNLLGSMPIDGLNMYELSYGAEAKTMLDEAKNTGDQPMVAQVAQRFCHTKAGIEANEILATLYLARGQVFPAALGFEKLLRMNPERTKLSDLTLFKATLAFRRAGDMKNYDETWKRLQASLGAKQGLKVGDDMIPMARVEGVLNETPVVDIINQHDWPMERGNPPRTAQAVGSPPLLDAPMWKRPLFKDKLEGLPEEDNDQAAYDRVMKAINQASAANIPVLPGGFPIASQGIMVVRSPRDIRAIALKPIDLKTDDEIIRVKPGEILWKSIPFNRSLAYLLEKPATRNRIDPWLDSYHKIPGFDSFLYDNTTLGSLATDHRLVYAINDLGVPPHPNLFQFQFNNPQMNNNIQDVKALLIRNELCAYDLKTGKMVWDLNGSDKEEDKDFKDSHFLSLPISIGGKLYVLNEKLLLDPNQPGINPFGQPTNPLPGESEIRLICIDPTKIANSRPEIVGKMQTLGVIVQHNRFVQDIPRRVNAVHLAYGEGVLVCPTNAGEVFGIDLMTRSLVWSYPYRETAHQMIGPPISTINPNIGFPRPATPQGTTTQVSKWRSSPPAIQDGKVVFTAPDADSIHCVNLRDGKPLWKRGQQKGDLYMAGVYQGRVLIVSDNKIRALDLKDGSAVWSIQTNDLPSGQGVASKGIYYLPLKKGEILAVDIAKGEVKAHNRSANPGVAPGNLIFYEGMVLSQTPTEVMAYPQLTARLDAAKLDVGNDPENLAKLTEFGDLLLKDGQVHLAVATLLKVYERKPADPLGKRVSARLFEALTDLMQVDFPKASRAYLTIYEALTKVPDNNEEQQARKAKYFRLVGQGREAQGDLVTAFQMYKDFGALPLHRDGGGIASAEDPTQKIPISVWLRGRIAGMLAKATPAQRAPLEAKIADEWKAVQAKNDFDSTRSFVGMFDVPFKVGREARVRLAETIMERNDRASFLEAELYLYQVLGSDFRAEPQTGGRALAALAQLEEKKGTVDSMRLAAAYYRQLGREFGDAPVRGNKTGADLFNELATDKRFLPFLEETQNTWGPVKMTARDLGPGAYPIGVPGFVMQPKGDTTPFARQHRLILNPSNVLDPSIKLRDSATGENRWEAHLGRVEMNQQIFFHMYQTNNVNQPYYPDARFRFYHVKGHLIVCQVGVMVYCLDGDTGRELWKMQTVENVQPGIVQLQQVDTNPHDGNPEFVYWNQQTQQRFRVSLGRIGSVQASHVAILGHKGLTVVDPLRGTTMWQKSDIPINSHVFGDDQYLFLVEVNENGSFGAGRTIRASDGETLDNPDFSNIYQAKLRVLGRQILAAQADQKNFTVRLYDILTGKDVWSKAFKPGSTVMHAEDKDITGVIEPDGKFTILDVRTGAELISNSIVQSRVGLQELAGLSDVLLLQDGERYYLALNRPTDKSKVSNGLIYNNFSNGTRCVPVNGWVLAYHKTAGQGKVGGKDVTWKKGDFHWHSQAPMANQMIVLDQFEQMPILLFTARYMENTPQGGNRWSWYAQSIQKSNGQWVYDSGWRGSNGNPWFAALQIDLKSRTISLMGPSGSVQHYVDEGKGPPPLPAGAMNMPKRQEDTDLIQFPQPVLPPNAFMPRAVISRAAQINELPAIERPFTK